MFVVIKIVSIATNIFDRNNFSKKTYFPILHIFPETALRQCGCVLTRSLSFYRAVSRSLFFCQLLDQDSVFIHTHTHTYTNTYTHTHAYTRTKTYTSTHALTLSSYTLHEDIHVHPRTHTPSSHTLPKYRSSTSTN